MLLSVDVIDFMVEKAPFTSISPDKHSDKLTNIDASRDECSNVNGWVLKWLMVFSLSLSLFYLSYSIHRSLSRLNWSNLVGKLDFSQFGFFAKNETLICFISSIFCFQFVSVLCKKKIVTLTNEQALNARLPKSNVTSMEMKKEKKNRGVFHMHTQSHTHTHSFIGHIYTLCCMLYSQSA